MPFAVSQYQRPIRLGITVLVALGTIAFLLWSILANWSSVASYSWRVEPSTIAAAAAAYAVAFAMGIFAWNSILGRVGHYRDVRHNTRIYCITTLMKRLPGGVWYVLGRMHMYEQRGVTRRVVGQATAYETAAIVGSGALVAIVALPVGTLQRLAGAIHPLVALALIVVGAAVVLACRHHVSQRVIQTLGLGQIPRWSDSAAWVGLYAVSWVAGGIMLFLLTQAAWPTSSDDLKDMVGIYALAGMSGLLAFFLPGGFGIREVSLTVLLSGIVPASLAAVIAVGSRVFLLLAELLLVGIIVGLDALYRSGYRSGSEGSVLHSRPAESDLE